MDTYSDSTMCFNFNCSSVPSGIILRNGCGVASSSSNVEASPSKNDHNAPWLPCDHFDGVLSYLNQILMEEDDLDDQRPCMYQDFLALQAAEKSFYDALSGKDNNYNSSPNSASSENSINCSADHCKILAFGQLESFQKQGSVVDDSHSCDPSSFFNEDLQVLSFSSNGIRNGQMIAGQSAKSGRANHREDDDEQVEERSRKHFASCAEDYQAVEDEYDKELFCRDPGFYPELSTLEPDPRQKSEEARINQPISGFSQEPKRGRPRAGDKKIIIREVVDLTGLLTQCAQALVSYDNRPAHELLNRIRQHSSPYGDATERLGHCFASALEARISGMGTTMYTALNTKRATAAETLKAYKSYMLASPFQRMSNIFANKSIGRLTRGATTIHIIDFGIQYGFQWPCFIHGVSLRPGGAPKIRITGIDFPQPGFRPAKRVEETGRRLARYSKRFNVPFEYHAIAKKWETISLEDLKIDRNETVVVNCLYRFRHVADETAKTYDSPRDRVLNLIRKIKPDLFVHGVVNGSYNAPFFLTRFRETLHHFSSLFDMFDKTLPREDQDRFLFEKEVLGKEAMNVIACEGSERVERPETYKQWQSRDQRTGLRQMPLIQGIVKEVREKVRLDYHKDFLVDEDCNWLLQGWKGRVIYAISCWKPING